MSDTLSDPFGARASLAVGGKQYQIYSLAKLGQQTGADLSRLPFSIRVVLEADVVVTEGNYLLLADPDWEPVRQCLDEVWFCALDDEVRRDRLITRHVDAGRTPESATEWVDRSDEANARRVSPTAAGADVIVVDGTPR